MLQYAQRKWRKVKKESSKGHNTYRKMEQKWKLTNNASFYQFKRKSHLR